MNKALLKALILKVVEEGMRADTGYKRQVWAYAREEVQKHVIPQDFIVTESHCKSKNDVNKYNWKQWEALTKLSGFAQNEDGTVRADNDVVQAYFIAHPRAKRFQRQALEYPELHRQLFEGVYATGEGAFSIEELVEGLPDEPRLSIEDTEDENEGLGRKRKHTLGQEVKKSKRLTSSDRMGNQVGRLADGLDELVKTLERDDQRDAIQELLRKYRALPKKHLHAVIALFKDEFTAKTFLALYPRATQKAWLRQQLEEKRDDLEDSDSFWE